MIIAVKALSVFLICCLVTISFGVAGCGGGGSKSPKISLAENLKGKTVEEFQPVTLSANATDEKDGTLKADSLVWTSDIDGELGTGETVMLDDLSAGTHTITVTATDSDGNAQMESFTLTVDLATGLIPREGDYLGSSFFRAELFWAAVTVRDNAGNDITGLELDDFTIRESLVSMTGEPVTEPRIVNIATQIEEDWQEGWFWEESLSDEKVDLVFLIENRGTMNDAMPGIKAQAEALVDRLVASHIDFRVGGVGIDTTPEIGGSHQFDFHGAGELDKLQEGMDLLFRTGGTWWNPVASYDSILWTPWLGFRKDARKILIAITDIPSQTIYGTYWYPVNCTAATRSAVELFLENNPDIELYYCLNPDDDVDYHQYTKDDINPMARNNLNRDGLGSGWGALESRGYATGLRLTPASEPWPFDQSLISIAETVAKDTKYYFILEPDFSWDDWDDYGDYPDDYLVRTAIELTIPGTGETYSTTIDHPITRGKSILTMNFHDELGNVLYDSVWSFLDYPIGSRFIKYKTQLYSRDSPVIEEVFPGTYHLLTLDGGSQSFDYQSIRAVDRRTFEVPTESTTINVTVPMAEREMFLTMARGILKDLRDNWRQPGGPFREFVSEAEAWLDELDREGIDYANMVRLMRFTVALSGYANIMEYSQQEIEKSVQNVEDIIDDIASIIAEVEAIQETTEFDWESGLGILLEIAYDIVTKGEFTIKKIAVEEGLEALLKYAGGELLEELKVLVCSELADKDYQDLLCTLVDVASKLPTAAEDGDWSVILEPLQKLAFNIALDQVRGLITDNFVEIIFSDLDLSNQLQNDLKGFVKDILTAMTSESGFDNFDGVIESFIENVIQHAGEQFFADNRDDVIAAIKGIFESLHDAVDAELGNTAAASFVSGFLLGMAEDMALSALPRVNENGSINYKPNGDALVSVLIKHTLYHLFLKDFFVDEAIAGLHLALENAMTFDPAGDGSYDWGRELNRDFHDYRSIMSDLQDTAWNALETQDAINSWATALQGLVGILEPLGVALDFMGAIYPPMKDTAERVHAFIAVLDGIQIVSTAIEFGLRVDSLDTFGDIADELSLTAFGLHEE